MRRYLFVFLSVFTTVSGMSYNADAQTLVRGKLVDESGSVVPFASVTLASNPQIGTVTNLMGEFSMQNISLEDILIVDHLGYEKASIPVRDISEVGNAVYTLTQKLIEIPEIVVTPNGVKDIIKEAISKIDDIYPLEYPVAHGIFRKQMMKGDEYAFFGECDMDLVWNSFPEMNRTGKYEQHQRVSNIKVSEDRFFHEMGYVSATSESMLRSYPISDFILKSDNFLWKVESISEKSGIQVMEVSFKESTPTQRELYGKIYISLEDHGIIASIYTIKSNTLTLKDFFGTTTMDFSPGKQTYSVYYKRQEGKWMFDYGRMEWISDAKITTSKKRVAEMNYAGEITMVYDYIVTGWSSIANQKEKKEFEKPSDPFIKLKDQYPKTDMSEFKVILPDYKF
jgi:hypothetical protein